MQPRMCLSLHNPPKSYGDCIRACVATLTDDDNVPHVFDDRNAETSWGELRTYLATKNKFLALFSLLDEDPLEFMQETNFDVPYMLMGSTVSGNHAVVCRNDKILHNPGYYGSKISGPTDLGCWIIGVIGNLL